MTDRCRHCRKNKISKARGLCYHCYVVTPWVRDLYPVSDHPHNRRGVRNFAGPAKPASAPTGHQAGSAEKIAVLAARAEAGEELFHPLDNPLMVRGTGRRSGRPRLKFWFVRRSA